MILGYGQIIGININLKELTTSNLSVEKIEFLKPNGSVGGYRYSNGSAYIIGVNG